MKKLFLVLLFALVAVPAAAGPIGTGRQQACVTITGDGGSSNALSCVDVDPTGSFRFDLAEPVRFGGDDGLLIDGLSFFGNTDPFISYALSVVDFGAPSSFTFTFVTPIVPDAYTHATSSLLVALTGDAGSAVSIAPLSPATTIQAGSAGTPSPFSNLGVDVGAACAGSGVVACAPESAEAFFAPIIYGGLTATAAFQLSGGGDRAQLTGSVTIDKQTQNVPEPTLAFLLGTALAGVVAGRHRRQ